MRSRLHSALLLAMATALFICGAFVAQIAHPFNSHPIDLGAQPGAPPVHQNYQ